MRLIDKSFLKEPKKFVGQSLLAALVVAIILYFIDLFTNFVIVAGLGASTFIVFAMPNSITARPRHVIGGHVVGVISGSACYYAFLTGPLGGLAASSGFIFIVACALSVGLAIFLMTITNTEHPPAAATALGIVAYGWSYQAVVFVLASAGGLALAWKWLKPRLKDLI